MMEENIDIGRLRNLFEEIIAASEFINNEGERIQIEDIDEIRSCLGLFNDFGQYVKNIMTKITERSKALGETESIILSKINEDSEIILSTSENIPDIKLDTVNDKPTSFDITKRKKHRVHKEKDYDKNICDEHTPVVEDKKNKTGSTVLLKDYDCSICDHKANNSKEIETHVKSRHTDIKLKCGQCHFTALEKRRIQLHKQKDHQGFTYPCTHCKFVATKYEVLKGHIKLEHEKVVDFECEKCCYITNEKKDFKKHMKIVHRK